MKPCAYLSLPSHSSRKPPAAAGLCCAALLARYGYRVTVVESHYHAGGAAHSFEVQGFHFDAGPSFFAGLSGEAARAARLLPSDVQRLRKRIW